MAAVIPLQPLNARQVPALPPASVQPPQAGTQTVVNTHPPSRGAQAQPSPVQRPTHSRPAGPAASAVDPRQGADILTFLLRTWRGNVITLTGLVIATIGLWWAVYSGIIGLRFAHVQACTSLISVGHSSKHCNETVDAAMTWIPMTKRDDDSPELVCLGVFAAVSLFAALGLTLAADVICVWMLFRYSHRRSDDVYAFTYAPSKGRCNIAHSGISPSRPREGLYCAHTARPRVSGPRQTILHHLGRRSAHISHCTSSTSTCLDC